MNSIHYIVADLDCVQARLALLRELRKGVVLQFRTQAELRPLVGRALLPSDVEEQR